MGHIKSLTVDKISLLTQSHSPAVAKAGIGFSILKFFRKYEPKKIDKAKLDDILKSLEGTCGTKEPEKVSKCDDILSVLKTVQAKKEN